MYKNQLQELAQRSCFNLPAYSCIREGPDHAPRFKATVNFSGETFESPSFCTTLRQAEHCAAEVALNALATRGPSHSLAARILDETGVYKNLLQEVSQRVGASLPKYTTFRSRHGHPPVFSCTVELAGVRFTGEPAKTKKQAEKNAAMTAWSSLKLLVQQSEGSSSEKDEQEHVTVARALQLFLAKAKMSNISLPLTFPAQTSGPPLSTQRPSIRASKILPFLTPKTAAPRGRPITPSSNNSSTPPNSATDRRPPPPPVRVNDRPPISQNLAFDSLAAILTANDFPMPRPASPIMRPHHQKFPAAEAPPYIPVRHLRPHHAIAPSVTMRNVIPVFSSPPLPPPPSQSPQFRRIPPPFMAPPVCIRQAVPAFAAPPPPPPPSSSQSQLRKTEAPPVQLAQDLQELKI